MKTIMSCCRLLFLIAFIHSVTGQTPGTSDETFSENRKFSAQISATRLDRPMLTVFSHAEGRRTHLWTRALVPEAGAEAGDDLDKDVSDFEELQKIIRAHAATVNVPLDPNELRKIVSNDGTTVILRALTSYSELPTVRVLTRGGGDKSYEAEDLLELLGEDVEDERGNPDEYQFFELFLESEKPPRYAMWYPPAAKWLVLDLEKVNLAKASAEEGGILDAIALPRAREIARQSNPTGIKKLVQSMLDRAAAFVPGVQPRGVEGAFLEMAEAAYRFLAHQKNAEDKKLIEALLEGEMRMWEGYSGMGWDGGALEVRVGLRSQERALADELLARWEGRAEVEDDEIYDFFEFGQHSALRLLGGIHGFVNLPFGTPKDAKGIWIYLIPASVEKWEGSDEVLKIAYQPAENAWPGQPDPEPIDSVEFSFDTLPPGKYRLKAVWDRRAPFTKAGGKDTKCIPAAGDYESAESKTIEIAAGNNARGVVLECTNRVGEAQADYAADQLWGKEHPARKDQRLGEAELMFARPKALVSAKVPAWVIRTNENKGDLQLKRIRLMARNDGDGEKKSLAVLLRIPGKKKDDFASVAGKLTDEHGCEFETRGYSSSGRIYEMNFDQIPYGSRVFTMSFVEETFMDENEPLPDGPRVTRLGSFTLTNLCGIVPENWNSEGPRAKKDLDIVSVELTRFEPTATEYSREHKARMAEYGPAYPLPGGRQYRSPENKFTFSANGQPAAGWGKIAGEYRDRWGNVSYSVGGFCLEEEVLKYTVWLARDPQKAAFLEKEKFVIPVKKIPGRGESLTVQAQKELEGFGFEIFSVGGTGEFTYKTGKLVSKREDVEEEGFVPQFAPARRSVQPKLYLKDNRAANGMNLYARMGRRVGDEVTVVAKIPHVVCRVPKPPVDTLFALVEQDTSIEEPMNAQPERMQHVYMSHVPTRSYSEIQVLPLDYRAGDEDRMLTFVVQKVRKAEFFVGIPKGRKPANQ